MLIKTLKWPVVSLLITGGSSLCGRSHLARPKEHLHPGGPCPHVARLWRWVGYKAIHAGGNYLNAILGAVILGILPIVLETFGFGMILGFGVAARFLVGVFAFSMILFGSLIGSGFALSKE